YFAGYDQAAWAKHFPEVAPHYFLLLPTQQRLALLFRVFPQLIRRYNIDYAHFQYTTPFVKNCRFIVTTHDVLFNDFPGEFSAWYRGVRNLLFKRSLLQSDIRLTVSEYSRQAIAQHYRIDPETIAISPNAVRPAFFAPYDKARAMRYIKQKFNIENYILYTSRIEPRKNHEMLLQAYLQLQLSKWGLHLVFIGNDTLQHPLLEQQIESLRGPDRQQFHWLKNIDDQDLLAFYRAARVFTYPSKAEGFGIPPLEAAACGIPTLCSNSTAMKDFDFLEEWAFSPYDQERYEQLLLKTLNHPPSKTRLQHISQHVQQNYSWATSAQRLHEEINKQTSNQLISKKSAIPVVAEP
ncbi:MAG: glycosyltransferase family 1 protein, partial [Bacteroidota bacterium]